MDRVHEEWAKEVAERFVNPLAVEWVSVQELHYNARGGRVKVIVSSRGLSCVMVMRMQHSRVVVPMELGLGHNCNAYSSQMDRQRGY